MCERFRFLGRLMAAACRDGFIVPLPLSTHFLHLVRGGTLTYAALPPPTEKSAAHEVQGRASRGSGCSGDGSGKDEVDTDAAAAAAATRLLAAMGPPGWGGALSSSAVALLDDEDGDALDASAYFADPLKERDRPVVFDDHLGLAVETCVGGYTCETLWDALIIS